MVFSQYLIEAKKLLEVKEAELVAITGVIKLGDLRKNKPRKKFEPNPHLIISYVEEFMHKNHIYKMWPVPIVFYRQPSDRPEL